MKKIGKNMKFNIEENIVYEDNHLLVVIKPQNVASQGDSSQDENILDLLKEFIKKRDNKPGNVFVGLVHRLDRPTGGVMVFAKTSKCASRLSEQMQSGSFEKEYFAVVGGVPKEKRGHLEHYLKKDESTNIVHIVPQLTTDAKLAILDYETLESNDQMSLLKVKLQTGRGHQIRVQLNAIGNAIVGDQKYGIKANCDMALWAYKLKFDHPITKERMCFICEPPKAEPWTRFDISLYTKM